MHLDPLTLTYISRSIDVVNFYVEVCFFSASVIAVSVKACIVIVLDMPFKHAPWPGALDLYFMVHWLSYFLRRSLVFSAPVIAASVKLYILNVLDIPFQILPWPGALDHVFSDFAQCKCGIDLRGVLVLSARDKNFNFIFILICQCCVMLNHDLHISWIVLPLSLLSSGLLLC